MAITPTKTWQIFNTENFNTGSQDNDNRTQLFNLKNNLCSGAAPWVAKLSCGNNGTGALVSGPTPKSVGGITLTGTDPVEITCVGHLLATGSRVRFQSVGGTTELNGNTYVITSTGNDKFTLDDTDSSAFSAWTTLGSIWFQDDVDRWTVNTDLVWSTGNHAWIVLEQSGIGGGGNFQILIDLDYAFTGSEGASVYISPGGRFLQGSTTARPTADDETLILHGNWGTSTVTQEIRGAYVCITTDGTCTRVYPYTATQIYAHWSFETPVDVVADWTFPWICKIVQTGGSPTLAQIFDGSGFFADTRMTGTIEKLFGTGLMENIYHPVKTSSGANRLHDNTWCAVEIGLDVDSNTYNRPVGHICDFWLISTALQGGQYLEGCGGPWKMMAIGTRFAQPWDGTTVWSW